MPGISSRELDGLKVDLKPPPATPKVDPLLSSRLLTLFHHSDGRCDLRAAGGRRLEPLYRDPNIYLVEHFLSPRELLQFDELITAQRAAFKQSKTDSSDTGEFLASYERTSESLVLPKSSTALLRTVEARAAELVGLPSDHTEPIQAVRYTNGASFHMHHDLAQLEEGRASATSRKAAGAQADGGGDDDATPSHQSFRGVAVEEPNGARRLVTLFVYLNTMPDGVGHTEFPLLKGAGLPRGVSCRPRAGAALVFCNVDAKGRPDARLCHQACPVPEGYWKYGLNLWVTDVTQQAHAVDAAPSPRKPPKAGAGRAASALSKLLFVEPADLPPPPLNALLGLALRRKAKGKAQPALAGRVEGHHVTKGYRLVSDADVEEYVSAPELLRMAPASADDLVGRRVKRPTPGAAETGGFVEGTVTEHDAKAGFWVEYDDGARAAEYLGSEWLLRMLQPKVGKKRRRS